MEINRTLQEETVRKWESAGFPISEVLQANLSRYFHQLDNIKMVLKEKFSRKEMALLVDICINTEFQTGQIKGILRDEVTEAGLISYEKWDVDRDVLLLKLKGLSPLEHLVMVNAIERYWQVVNLNSPPPPLDPTHLLD